MENAEPPRMRIEISWKTIIKILLGVLLAYVMVRLWPVFELLIAAILIAVPLHRLASWLCKKGWPRWAAVGAPAFGLILLILGIFGLAGPIAFNQASTMVKDLPRIQQQLASHVRSETLHRVFERVKSLGTGNESQQLGKILGAAKSTVRASLTWHWWWCSQFI